MEHSIHGIQPTRPQQPERRRDEPRRGGKRFRLAHEPAPAPDEAPHEPAPAAADDERPLAPRPDDEAGSHLDLTA